MSNRTIPIDLVVDWIGVKKKERREDGSYYCKCPFCKTKATKFTLNVDPSRNLWRCVKCGLGGGSTSLYTFYTRGKAYKPEMRAEIIPEMEKALGLESDPSDFGVYRHRDFVIDVYNEYKSLPSQYPEISDYKLNLFHQKILSSPLLKLGQKDKGKLLARGLTEEAIQRNGYRTYRQKNIESAIPKEWWTRYRDENWSDVQKKNPVLAKMSKERLLCCLYIGQCLTEDGMNPMGMPGAFKFRCASGIYWGFRLYDGIIIPIRNIYGEIVALQVRTENKERKYMLISSRSMPCGRIGRSRIHHPLANAEGERVEATEVVVTEGPLKVDVYSCLAPAKHYPFKSLGVIGVQNTAMLIKELKMMKCSRIIEAYDMDKFLNFDVMNAILKMKKLCRESDIEVRSLLWDEPAIDRYLKKYQEIAQENGVALTSEQKSAGKAAMLGFYCREFAQRQITVSDQWRHWDNRTKGIDDMLLDLSRSQKNG